MFVAIVGISVTWPIVVGLVMVPETAAGEEQPALYEDTIDNVDVAVVHT
jgi:hypothetical protein